MPQYKKLVIIPDTGMDLLRAELAEAFSDLGFTPLRVQPAALRDEAATHYLPRLLDKNPALFFSVNLQGILPGGDVAKNLISHGVPVVAWFVDNPWHILSGMRDPSWKSFYLALTDNSFAAPLLAAGAKKVLHMPLAAATAHLQAEQNTHFAGLREIAFVGRTVFPGMEDFFAGQDLPPESLAKAHALLKQGFGEAQERPDFKWWVAELGLQAEEAGFWPGKKSRRPGLGAATCNTAWRKACLEAAADSIGGLSVFGDAAWARELGDRAAAVNLCAPLDYYTQLPQLYSTARFCVNLNSLLLPAGLTQRIFDIWAAGGFCLTDWSAGLDIFPEELVTPICFKSSWELTELTSFFRANSGRRGALRRAWYEHIATRHNYRVRLSQALQEIK